MNPAEHRVVKVPWTDRWLARFNERFAIVKGWDGSFKSRLGPGHCIAGRGLRYMEYHFAELKGKE